MNERIYDTLNNGVYKSGFATTQFTMTPLLSLVRHHGVVEERLTAHRYLMGDRVTEVIGGYFPRLPL